MSQPIDTILARAEAYGLRPNGASRWRCACPVCGGNNRSTLSIGASDAGAVLLKCFKSECSIEAISGAFGLDVVDLFPPRDAVGNRPQRRRLLTDRQALELLIEEATFIAVLASTMAQGMPITDADRARAHAAVGRINYLRTEAMQ